ncbi:LysR substrate-binding domain-containing protein [uncultured Brevundimonas sp.]|uniref:LysR substrate-binding domain-containing protein n=1 Tax=uncultured Brevundimonas sp. TaxID=213418 RepID=UPI0025F970D2|nr:LysR substrate-binding domain-containing protein [uncultured Brevundimonas sp.]
MVLRLLDPERIETLKAERIIPNAVGPVIAPSLAGGDARTKALSAPRLTARTHPSGWKDWAALSGRASTATSERPVAHLHFVLDAALAGWGAAVLPWALAAEAVADGRLLAPFGFHADDGAVAAIPGAGEASRARRAFVRWLVDQGRAMPSAPKPT